ncbi:MAG: hypothetical protein ABI137_12310 [Antricoccus sp.]
MTNDAEMILVNGMALDRDTVAASLKTRHRGTPTNLRTRLVDLGENTAALIYRARAGHQERQRAVYHAHDHHVPPNR